MAFQSTLRRTERLLNRYVRPCPIYFNPRSGERSDLGWHTSRQMFNEISIHAPANGATQLKLMATYYIGISIHAPANGATKTTKALAELEEFQSTLRRTERLEHRTL